MRRIKWINTDLCSLSEDTAVPGLKPWAKNILQIVFII
jgi:hypothetical protein